MRMYYHVTSTDSEGKEKIEKYYGNYFAVTPEIILNNNFSYEADASLQARIDNGETIIVAPVGRDVEMIFPIKDVIDYYQANSGALAVINTLAFDIPAEAIENEYGIEPPADMLMVLSSKKNSFPEQRIDRQQNLVLLFLRCSQSPLPLQRFARLSARYAEKRQYHPRGLYVHPHPSGCRD